METPQLHLKILTSFKHSVNYWYNKVYERMSIKILRVPSSYTRNITRNFFKKSRNNRIKKIEPHKAIIDVKKHS